MKTDSEFNLKRIMQQAEKDPQYNRLLEYYRDMEWYYRQISDRLPQEETTVIEQYLAAGEAVYYRFSQLAYQCGKRSRKK